MIPVLKEKHSMLKIFVNTIIFFFVFQLINLTAVHFVLKIYLDMYERAIIEDFIDECVMYISIVVIYWTLRSKQRGLYFSLPVVDEANPLEPP